MDELLKEIELIKDRNTKVEINKAWETSLTRKIGIAVLTYFVVLSFFLITNVNSPYTSAIVPTLGFLLSTLSLDFLKKIWISKFNNKK